MKDMPAGRRRLTTPPAERLGCERVHPGTAVLPRTDEVLNAAGTINGGLIAVAAEEAALSPASENHPRLPRSAISATRAGRPGDRDGHPARWCRPDRAARLRN